MLASIPVTLPTREAWTKLRDWSNGLEDRLDSVRVTIDTTTTFSSRQLLVHTPPQTDVNSVPPPLPAQLSLPPSPLPSILNG